MSVSPCLGVHVALALLVSVEVEPALELAEGAEDVGQQEVQQ
jgi:hypothetical protein